MGLEKLHDAHTREWEHLFVGRQRELAAVDQWLATAQAPTCVFSVTGMGGIGKSTLVRQIVERARRAGATAVWIDGRACTRTPAGFLQCLLTVLDVGPELAQAPRRVAAFVRAAGPRTVWCVDNYEELEALDGWFREGFLAELPTRGHLVVLASRQRLLEGWHTNPVWRKRVRAFPLEPFSRAEAREYLRRAGVREQNIEHLVRQTGGLPLALSVAADAYTRRAPLGAVVGEAAMEVVSANLLREVAGEELARVLDVLACVPEADAEMLGRVLGKPVPLRLLVALTRLSFVQPTATGFRLHEVAQRFLMAELRQRDPAQFRRTRRRVVAVLLERLAEASPAARGAIAAALLAVCADALPSVASYAILSATPLGPIRAAQKDDLPVLLQLLRGWGRQPFLLDEPEAYARLLTRLVHDFPESCRVVAGSDGRPAGFLCAVLLSRETVACLDAVAPGALERHLPDEYKHLASLAPEHADTYLALMLGRDLYHKEYTSQELVGLSIRDGLAHLGEGTRALVGGTNPDLVRLLSGLGFVPYVSTLKAPGAAGVPGPASANGRDSAAVSARHKPRDGAGLQAGPERLFVLDLRDGRFGPWVVSLLQVVDGPGADFVSRTLVPLSELRRLLLALHDADAWRSSPLPAVLGWEPDALREQLLRMVTGRGPLPPPLTDYDRAVLEGAAWRGLSPVAAAAQLHVSRATYYRHLERAVKRLHQALTNPLAFHSPTDRRSAHK